MRGAAMILAQGPATSPSNTDWVPMALFGISFLVIVGLFTLSIFSIIYGKRKEQQRSRGVDPTCGGCGYSVRELTTLTCPECGADLREVGIIPPAQPSKPAPTKEVSSRWMKTATVLVTDMIDFTARAAGSSRDEALKLLRRQRDTVQPIVNRRGGRVIKSTGDGVIATFDSATDALLAAVDIQVAVKLNNSNAFSDADRFVLRIGVSTGEVALLDNDVLGHPVNLASRVQQLAEPGRVYFTDSTYHAMNRKEIVCEDLGAIEVRGVSGKINLYRCVVAAAV